MYRNCIFCSADLGSNESIEHFPVGRSVAFDGAKGRLWAICAKCARWNLAPLEERWESIEAGERLFRDARVRGQSENVGVAKLADGTRLIRVGGAAAGELAAWRYGGMLAKRPSTLVRLGAAAALAGTGIVVAGVVYAVAAGFGSVFLAFQGYTALSRRAHARRTVGWVETELSGTPQQVRVRREDAAGAWLSDPDDGRGVALNLPLSVQAPDPRRPGQTRRLPLVVRGEQAHRVMARALAHLPTGGRDYVPGALRALEEAGSPAEYVRTVARRRLLLNGADPRAQPRADLGWGAGPEEGPAPNPVVALALEMALHEEAERRALEGELAALEAMWKEAEEIAAIADGLLDFSGSKPPRTD